MKHFLFYVAISALLLCATLMVGCHNDQEEITTPIQPGRVSVALDVTSPEIDVQTRASGSVDNSIGASTTIKDLNIFLWNDANKYHKHLTSISGAALDMLVGRYKVVAIANAGKSLEAVDPTTLGTATLAQLGVDGYNNAIMTYNSEINVDYGGSIAIPLLRTFAYVAFNFNIHSTFPGCTLVSYRLGNVPTTTTVAPLAASSYTPAALCTATTEKHSLGDGVSVSDKIYVFENSQPDVPSITDTKDRTKDTAPAGAMYMELLCKLSTGKLITYRLYLGDGSPSSFSVRRNTQKQYNVTVYSENDARASTVSVSNTFISRYICTQNQNSSANYLFGKIIYTGSSNEIMTGKCRPVLAFQPQNSNFTLLRDGGGGFLIEGPTPTPLTVVGNTATATYMVNIPTSALLNESQITYTRTAYYSTDRIIAWSDTQTAYFGFKATLECPSIFTTIFKAQNSAVQWSPESDGVSSLVIDCDATNKVALFEIRGTNAGSLINITNKAGTAVGYDIVKTPTSVVGKILITGTDTYTANFASVTISCQESNKNVAYQPNTNNVIIGGVLDDVTVEVSYSKHHTLALSKASTTTTSGEITTQKTPLLSKDGATQRLTIVLTPQSAGAVNYSIVVRNKAGISIAQKSVTATIAALPVKLNITLKYGTPTSPLGGATHYATCVAECIFTTVNNYAIPATFPLATITFTPTGFSASSITMGNTDDYCMFWSLTSRTPVTNYVTLPPVSARTITYDISHSTTIYQLFGRQDFWSNDLDYNTVRFGPQLGNLDGSISVSRQTDLLKTMFVNVEFPPAKSNSVRITYTGGESINFSDYDYRNKL